MLDFINALNILKFRKRPIFIKDFCWEAGTLKAGTSLYPKISICHLIFIRAGFARKYLENFSFKKETFTKFS